MRIIGLLLLAVSLTFAQWGGGGGKSINDFKKISVSGRDVHVWAPSGLADNSPLLLSLHGMDQDPNYQQQNTHWEAVADTAGFVVAYLRGGTGFSTWDISGDQDTKWVTQIIDQLAKDYKIDTKRVYLSGFSMGGMFSYHAMSKIADRIAAFAPCSGYLMGGAGVAMRPVPIFHVHGTGDDVVGYSGLENNLGSYRKQFNCPSQAEVQNNYPHTGDKATLYTWGPCDGGVTIKHLKLQGRGHSPSAADVSDIWNFIKLYDVDGLISDKQKTDAKDTAKTDTAKVDTAKTDTAKVDTAKTDTTKTDKKDSTKTGKDDRTFIANAGLLLTSEKTFSVYNMKGSFVCTVKASSMGDVQIQLNSMKLDKGLYVVKSGNSNRVFSVK